MAMQLDCVAIFLYMDFLKPVAEFLQTEHIAQIIDQGHTLTSKLERSVSYVLYSQGNTVGFRMSSAEYGIYVNKGVKRSRIPYGGGRRRRRGGTGSGRSSAYIEGLKKFVRLRRMATTEKQVTSIAFAIAAKHKQEGMPTRASARFSSTGKRKGWVDIPLKEKKQDIDKMVSLAGEQQLREQFEQNLTRYLR